MQKINTPIVLRILGLLLCLEALFMLLPLGVSLLYGEADWTALSTSAGITFGCGALLAFRNRNHDQQFRKREGFLIVALSWVLFSLFGMLPFLLSGAIGSVTDAYFETMSGFTTTGASVLDNVESLPHGLLFWRSLIQWLGGMGIILFTLAVLPMLNSGSGIQLYNAEVTGYKHDKLRPRISETAKRLWLVYLTLTALLTVLLVLGPMNLFDAVCHALTTLATGGYSTKQASVAYWHSPYIDYTLSLFMLIASINFGIVYHAATGKPGKLFRDEETRWFLITVLAATVVITGGLLVSGIYADAETAFRNAFFQVSSLISTTGFASADFQLWGSFLCSVLLLIMIMGGCAGSTAGGAKTIRIVVLFKNIGNEFYRQVHPNAVVPVRINGQMVEHELVSKILGFIFLYLLVTAGCSLILTGTGLPFEDAVASSITAISNVGPGLGSTGPAASFSHVSPIGKWALSFTMLVGRLELFTVLVLFSSAFWKK